MKAADDFIVPLTLCAEASSEPDETRQWIAWTIYNRTLDPRYPKTMAAVCLQRYQYSEFNDDRLDNANLLRVVSLRDDDPQWLAAEADYHAVMGDIAAGVEDPTSGSTHFYAEGIDAPPWTVGARFAGQVGRVRFYAEVK